MAAPCIALALLPVNAQQPVSPTQLSTAVPGLASNAASPIAIVPVDGSTSVTGALEVTSGKAIIANTGTITSGVKTTEVILPHRGVLRVCASTTVKLATDTSVPAGETPGLMMALDHGAVETSFATGRNSDILLTPDFRILISTPGSSDVKIRLGDHGDTCVDNPGAPGTNAPYVIVTSVFDGGAYRLQPGQRVMFQHGSLAEVVDDEKEPCGCPPDARPGTNEFPLAQSAGLGPQAPPITAPQAPPITTRSAANQPAKSAAQSPIDQPLVYEAQSSAADQPAAAASATESTQQSVAMPAAPTTKPTTQKKRGFFHGIGNFFRKIFGAE